VLSPANHVGRALSGLAWQRPGAHDGPPWHSEIEVNPKAVDRVTKR